MKVWLSLTVIILVSLTIKVTPVSARETLFEDDFSQGFQKWTPVRNGQMWSIVDGQAEAFVPSGSTLTEMIPKDQYWNSQWQNIEYHLDYTPIQGVDKNISFGFENLTHWYEIHFVESTYNLVRLQDGTTPFNIFNPYIMQNGQTYHLVIEFNQGHIRILVNGQVIGDEVDATFNNNYGKIGIKAGTGAVAPTRVRFDNIKVYALNQVTDTKLDLSLIKQTDSPWKDKLYDHATQWSTQPTIGRWGCVLTSLSMILNYHGIKQLPDGQLITPLTLNAWLLTQPDGFIGEGSVNWLAITRLTRLINQRFQTPKLEYLRHDGNSLATAIAEITDHKPVILQIAGHFLVGDGFTADNQDVYIKDPDFNYERFSQHQTALLSTRTFTPSFTNLSYFLFTHQPGLELRLTQPNGQVVSGSEGFSDTLAPRTNNPSAEKTPPLIQHTVAQPAAGRYQLTISQPTLQPYQYQFFSYDQAGNVKQFSQTGWVGPRPLISTIDYSATGQTKLTTKLTYADFRQDLALVKNQGLFKAISSYWWLDQIALQAQTAPAKQQTIWWLFLKVQLLLHHSWLKPVGYLYLDQQLDLLKP